jgi:hypothetical protein
MDWSWNRDCLEGQEHDAAEMRVADKLEPVLAICRMCAGTAVPVEAPAGWAWDMNIPEHEHSPRTITVCRGCGAHLYPQQLPEPYAGSAWRVTFGAGTPLGDGWVTVYALDEEAARIYARDTFGPAWAGIYPATHALSPRHFPKGELGEVRL